MASKASHDHLNANTINQAAKIQTVNLRFCNIIAWGSWVQFEAGREIIK